LIQKTCGGIPDIDQIKSYLSKLQKIKDSDQTIFTSAHQSTNLNDYRTSMSYLIANHKKLASGIIKAIKAKNLQQACFVLEAVPFVGRFISWQITCDLLESGCFENACTESDWAVIGLGSLAGIKFIFKDSSHAVKRGQLLEKIQDDVYREMGVLFPKFNNTRITLKNIEHSLCELSKYIKQSSKKGKLGRCRVWDPKASGKGSRSYLDEPKECETCKGKSGECSDADLFFCDTCLRAFCKECLCDEINTQSSLFVCSDCTQFSTVSPRRNKNYVSRKRKQDIRAWSHSCEFIEFEQKYSKRQYMPKGEVIKVLGPNKWHKIIGIDESLQLC